MESSQLKTIPPLIRKKQFNFTPLVKRKKTLTSEFRGLVIGKHFKFYEAAEGVNPSELELTLVKVAASNMERNARVVSTCRAKENPVGQMWTINPLCPVIEVNFP